MIFETLITSAQRGIRPGRTGFQPVMQTSALREDILRQLEPFAAYRHVHQQGSGKNPECCSFRRLRTNIGELFVLVRTVDAGNDYSNRSNKCSHILAITADEIGRFFNSTPANILADNPSLFLSNWMGGPESRAVPPQLMSLPHRPAPCAQWQSCFGDAALAGVVAQRIRERKPTLFVAQDSTPQSSQLLLKLFAEASALLNQAERWDTTFETTILGKSQSLLQGTYRQSAESEIQQTGLLRLEVGHQQQVPAELMNSPLCVLAREGEKQQSTSSQASAAGVQQATRQSLQGKSQPTAPPKLPSGRGTTASPPTSASPVMPHTRDVRSARSQAHGTMQPPVPLQKEERSWGMWAALVFAFPVTVIFFIVLVVLLREPVMDFITNLKNKIDNNEAVVAEKKKPESEGDVSESGGDMSQAGEKTKADPGEMVDKQGGGANNGKDSKTKKKSDSKPGPSKEGIWDKLRNQVGKFVGTDAETTGNPNQIKITDTIENLKDIQGEIHFKFAKVRAGKEFDDIFLTSEKSDDANNEWLVKHAGKIIGKFVIDDDQIYFRRNKDENTILHCLIPVRIEWPKQDTVTDFFCLKDRLPDTEVDQLSLTIQLNSGKPTYLRDLFKVGKQDEVGPLKIPGNFPNEYSWLQKVASVRLEMQPLEEPVTSEHDDTTFGISINRNKLKISVKNGEQNLVEPIELSLAPKLVATGVEIKLKEYSGIKLKEYSGWLNDYNIPDAVRLSWRNKTDLNWSNCKKLEDRITRVYVKKNEKFQTNNRKKDLLKDFLWTDLYNAGDINQEFRRKEASFNVLSRYTKPKEMRRDWEAVTVGGDSQKNFEKGFKEVFGEKEWVVFSKTTRGGQSSNFSSYASNRPSNIIKEELKNLDNVTRFVSQDPNEDTWSSLLRTKLVKAFWFCKDEDKYNIAYPKSEVEEERAKSGVEEERAKAEQTEQQNFENDTEDTKKLHEHWQFLKKQVEAEITNKNSNTASGPKTKLVKSQDWEALEKSYNNDSGFWAGLLLQELPKAYLCEIAKKPLYEEEGLMEVTDLSKKLTGEIFCTVQMGEEESEVIIGNIESAR